MTWRFIGDILLRAAKTLLIWAIASAFLTMGPFLLMAGRLLVQDWWELHRRHHLTIEELPLNWAAAICGGLGLALAQAAWPILSRWANAPTRLAEPDLIEPEKVAAPSDRLWDRDLDHNLATDPRFAP